MEKEATKKPSFMYAFMILVMVIAIISTGMLVFGASIQIMMFTALIAVIPLITRLGYTFKEVEQSAYESMLKALQPGMIILTVGILIGAWMASGTVPSIIYYGIESISPSFFLVITLVLCSVVSLATGASWATVGTAGIAMMGVGHSLGVPVGMTAGAIVSGAFFGDKMSPLSDSTNLSAAVAGAELMDHIKHMLLTTGPAYIITAMIFTVLGLIYGGSSVSSSEVNTLTGYLAENFNLGLIPLIPPAIVITLLVMKKPPVPSIFIGALAGAAVAIAYQGVSVNQVLTTFFDGYYVESGIEMVDTLLQQGGLTSMLPLVALYLFALGLGGILYSYGVLEVILESVVSRIKSRGMLVFVSMFTGYAMLGIGGSFSFSGVMTGTLLKPLFEKFNLRPENLSRIIEDTATQSAPLVPWTAGGLFTAAALGVSPLVYIPFSFLAIFTPMFTLFYGITGYCMKEKKTEKSPHTRIKKLAKV
ncbi:Na+/H+ antiporter NhaC [Lentibacillus cibarius]|uniref:Na+/H+ antiporter NhaC n=1 Tax=Lentibacillus cibarius TaxID=2583219 RepID=A0A549YEZ3_9BACI|nr:Na+/H+ antiporter NhaC [Lentibacillus cibarius]TMN21553.1 Na+/H+ antiporter NhaC [Lentibacillus cibarius]TRM10454.1 Na+/H+ antiporter NhaC [Lentibacillus cibarius]